MPMGKKITSIIALLCAYCTVFAANYLTFTAEEDSSSFRIYEDVMDDSHVNIQYSLDDGQTWKDLYIIVTRWFWQRKVTRYC